MSFTLCSCSRRLCSLNDKRQIFITASLSLSFSPPFKCFAEILSSWCCSELTEFLPFMDLTGAPRARYDGVGPFQEATGFESLHLRGSNEFRQPTKLTLKNARGFTSLLELPPTQVLEFLHYVACVVLRRYVNSSTTLHAISSLLRTNWS